MTYVFDLLSNFFGFQVELLWTIFGVMDQAHLGLYPVIENQLIEFSKLCLFALESIAAYYAATIFIAWYEVRNASYQEYLKKEEQKKQIELNQITEIA